MDTVTHDQERFVRALLHTTRLLRSEWDRRLKRFGLSQASWHTIITIVKYSTLSQVELAGMLEVESTTVGAMVNRLASHGYLLRVTSDLDRRVKLIQLTERGHDVYREVDGMAKRFHEELFVGIDNEKLASTIRFFDLLQTSMKATKVLKRQACLDAANRR